MSARAKYTSWISAPMASYDPASGTFLGGRRPIVGAKPSLQELLDLEKVHVAAAEKAESEGRWLDASREWESAADMLSKAATLSGAVDREVYFQRFKEHRRRAALALGESTKKQPGAGALALLLAAAVGGLYAAYNPSGAMALARSASSKVSGAVKAGASKVRGIP